MHGTFRFVFKESAKRQASIDRVFDMLRYGYVYIDTAIGQVRVDLHVIDVYKGRCPELDFAYNPVPVRLRRLCGHMRIPDGSPPHNAGSVINFNA
jgi:hypothetical protein